MKIFLKETIMSLILSIIGIFILSILISKTTVPEKVIIPAVIGITSISIMIGGFKISKSRKEKGIINGCILGGAYMLIMYIISSIITLDFSLTMNSIIMIMLGILGGAIGGIFGVNFNQ